MLPPAQTSHTPACTPPFGSNISKMFTAQRFSNKKESIPEAFFDSRYWDNVEPMLVGPFQ
jgi:hypothetical protein